jgi:hypothetical protein
MKKVVYLLAALVLGSFAFADGDHGRGVCMSTCAKAVAEHRKMCGTMHGGDTEAFKSCMVDAQMHFDTCTAGCNAAEE